MEILKVRPTGVCPQEMLIEIDNDKVISYKPSGGCPGNSLGINALVSGMPVDEVISKLKGIKCGFKNTSCPNELAKALENYKKESKN